MLYTLQQAVDYCKRQVQDGTCDFETARQYINDALERLADYGEWESMQAVVRIATDNLSFTLPYNVEKIIAADLNGVPGLLHGRMFQFLSGGPGDMDSYSGSWPYRDFLDQGAFPTQFDIPAVYELPSGVVETRKKGMRICAFSTHKSDVGKTISIRGTAPGGVFVNAGSLAGGEDIEIQRWDAGNEGRITGNWNISAKVSQARFCEVTEIVKPVTKGYITLMACDVNNSLENPVQFFSFLAKYHPRETVPQFRRYAVMNYRGTCCPDCILALVKMRCVPLVDPEDVLPIESLQAVRAAVQGISAELKENLQLAQGYFTTALQLMNIREQSRTVSSGMPSILHVDFRGSNGRFANNLGEGWIL
jgi:hypothetical protein